MIRRMFTLGAAVVVLLLAAAPSAGATPGAAQDDRGRVLLLSLPGLTWSEVQDHELPNIEALLEDSALADLAPRGVQAQATPGAAYLTISAGTRAVSVPLVDGQQLALGDQSAGSTAGEIFERRTGLKATGEYVSLGWPALDRENASEPFDAELGLLAETLSKANYGSAVIGNADGTDTVAVSYERQVGLTVATGVGEIREGELGTELLEDAPENPFGRRLNIDRVVEQFAETWETPGGHEGGLVVVEASDLARTMRYRDRVEKSRYDEMRSEALLASDELVGRLLEQVDPERDAVLLVGPYNQAGDRDLTAAALRAPGSERGYLRSASTQRSGFLTLVDIAPTVLHLLDVERPDEMEGRAAEVDPSGDSLSSRVDRLAQLNAASRFRERLLFPTTLVVVVALAAVCGGAVVVSVRRRTLAARRIVIGGALALLAVLPLSYLVRAFPLEDWGPGFYWTFVLVGAVLVAVGAMVLGQVLDRRYVPLVTVLGLVLGVLVLDVMTGSHLSLSAAFGYSPTGNSRLYGISNYSFGQVAAAASFIAAVIAAGGWSRLSPGRSRLLAVGLLFVVLVVIGMPTWGADVGGVLAFTPTVLVFAALISRGRLRLWHLAVGGLATVVAVTAFGFLDLARPADQRGHLGRLFERIGNEGAEPLLSIMERKLLANLGVSSTSFWIAAIPLFLLFLAFLAWYPGRLLDLMRSELPTLHAGLIAAIVAALLGSLVNDSGAIVGGVTLLVTTAALVILTMTMLPPPPSPTDVKTDD